MTLIIFFIILSILVLVHEFGHFIVAKKLGIRVEEFGLGIPPKVLAKKFGETIYSLNLLPFGGFVRVTGEDAVSEQGAVNDPRSFASKTPGQRAAVLVAGVVMNFVLAVSLFYVVLFSTGLKTQYIPLIFDHDFKYGSEQKLGAVVVDMMKDSSAEKAKIQRGEAILAIDDMPISDVYSLRNSLKGKLGSEVAVKLKDIRKEINGPERTLNILPQTDEEGNVILGVYVTKAVSLDYSNNTDKWLAGFLHSYNVLDFSLKSLGKLVGLSYEAKSIEPVSQSVSGPVGIYQLIGGLIDSRDPQVLLRLMDFVALMSLSLALINILPFPALDGGRLLFVVIEKIRGKPLSVAFESQLHKFGFIALMAFLIAVTIKDLRP